MLACPVATGPSVSCSGIESLKKWENALLCVSLCLKTANRKNKDFKHGVLSRCRVVEWWLVAFRTGSLSHDLFLLTKIRITLHNYDVYRDASFFRKHTFFHDHWGYLHRLQGCLWLAKQNKRETTQTIPVALKTKVQINKNQNSGLTEVGVDQTLLIFG